MNYSYVMKTELAFSSSNVAVSLVNLRRDHFRDIFEYSSDPEFCRYLGSTVPSIPEDVLPFLEMVLRENDLGVRQYFGICSQGKIVGTTGLLNINPDLKSAELGYGVARKYWGSGIIQQSVSQVIDMAFNQMDIALLHVGTKSDNFRSRRFAEKIGFSKLSSDENKTWYELRNPKS